MVWRADESPLYRSVEKFNSKTQPPEKEPDCRKKPETPHEPAPKRSIPANKGLINRIAGDKDFLLIAALIFLLWHEKADIKLIAALAYVLLG